MNKHALPIALVALASTLMGCAEPVVESDAPNEEPPVLAVSWVAEPGEQVQKCVSVQVDEDIDVAAIDTFAPPGTQRLIAWHAPAGDAADGCPAVDPRGLLFDGLDPFELPTGVALDVPAGRQLWLRADIVNDGDAPRHGESGVTLDTTKRATETADVVDLAADVGDGDRCEMPVDTFLFAVASDIAGDARVELVAHSSFAGGDVTLTDVDTAGTRLLDQPVALRAGEAITASCLPGDGVFATAASDAVDCEVAVYRFPAGPVDCQ